MISSAPMAVPIASAVVYHASRMPNDRCAPSRMLVMSSGGRYLLSTVRNRRRPSAVRSWTIGGASVDIPLSLIGVDDGLLDVMKRVNRRVFDGLLPAGGPANHDAIDSVRVTESVMQATLVLCAESARRCDLLHLLTILPVQLDLRTDRASIGLTAFH